MRKINFKKIVDHVIQRAPGLAAGAIASKYVGKGIEAIAPGKSTPMITAGATILAGAVLPGLLGSGKNDKFFAAAGDGMMVQGLLALGKEMKIPGMAGVDDPWETVSGLGAYEDDMTISGTSGD